MNNQSGTASQMISLPQGGGALHGMGETFSPDLHTGTGNFSVPIDLPPGRNNLQPTLSLVYSTGTGNGPFGLGWSVSVPGIHRKTSKGVPQYDDAQDIFILSGAEDLVPVPGGTTVTTRYRPRTEGLFAHIEHHHDADNDYWEVQSKDGLVSRYGALGTGDHQAVVADPSDRSKIFSWHLTQTQDPFGNLIVYEYERDSGNDGSHAWDQVYLKRLRYADYAENNETKFLISVTFDYDDRPDPFSGYRAGFEIRTRKRCTRIDIHTHAEQNRLVRSHHLVYMDQQPSLESFLPHNGVSLLSQIQVVGHDGDRTESLPPLAFGYTPFEPETQ